MSIDSLKKSDCVGCGACYVKCPLNSISFDRNDLGFKYPQINHEKCIECNLCEKVCPVMNNSINEEDSNEYVDIYAAYSKDEDIRKKSSSGGLFSVLANHILFSGGLVVGASFDEGTIKHIIIDSDNSIVKLRGSKYVQSDLSDALNLIKNELDNGKIVYFSGTPCQVMALYSFLGKRYINLYTQDLVCHGVMSPIILDKYIENNENKFNSEVEYINFRDKTYGWNNYSMFLQFVNGNKSIVKLTDDSLLRSYSSNLCLRESCYNCKFKSVYRNSDITLADFWNIDKVDSSIDWIDGVSCVFPHSIKGNKLFEDISENIVYKQEKLEDFIKYNQSLVKSPQIPEDRDSFIKDVISSDSMSLVVNKYQKKDGYIKRVIRKIKYMINKV